MNKTSQAIKSNEISSTSEVIDIVKSAVKEEFNNFKAKQMLQTRNDIFNNSAVIAFYIMAEKYVDISDLEEATAQNAVKYSGSIIDKMHKTYLHESIINGTRFRYNTLEGVEEIFKWTFGEAAKNDE